jgi:uncharacterized membrane protein
VPAHRAGLIKNGGVETDSGSGEDLDAGSSAEPDKHAVEGLRAHLQRLERRLDPERRALRETEQQVVLPAWRRITSGESRWPATLAVLAAIVMQLALPDRVATRPRWLLPVLAALLLIAIFAANPGRINRPSRALRVGSMTVIALLSLANAWSAARLIAGLLGGTEGGMASSLLLTGAAIWMTNVIVFSLWYWELDRGGPGARAHGARQHPDFLFAQMETPELAPEDWEPAFADYLFLSFTNAAAFSPTDVLPLSRWAKLVMMGQALVSLATVVLVIARAVNILR